MMLVRAVDKNLGRNPALQSCTKGTRTYATTFAEYCVKLVIKFFGELFCTAEVVSLRDALVVMDTPCTPRHSDLVRIKLQYAKILFK